MGALPAKKLENEIEGYIRDIKRFRVLADECVEDAAGSLLDKIDYLTQAYGLMGRVTAHLKLEYRKAYNLRKRTFAEKKRDAPRGDKANAALLATLDLMDKETEAEHRWDVWDAESEYIKEELFRLHLLARNDTALMRFGGGGV